MKDTARDIVRQRGRWKGLMSNIWAHDIAERMKIRRKVFAKDSGLGDMDVGTFPSEGATHTLIERGTNPVSSMLLAGVMAAVGAGGYSLLSNRFDTAGDKSVINLPKVASPTVKPIELEIEVINGEDGLVIESVVVPPDAD